MMKEQPSRNAADLIEPAGNLIKIARQKLAGTQADFLGRQKVTLGHEGVGRIFEIVGIDIYDTPTLEKLTKDESSGIYVYEYSPDTDNNIKILFGGKFPRRSEEVSSEELTKTHIHLVSAEELDTLAKHLAEAEVTDDVPLKFS